MSRAITDHDVRRALDRWEIGVGAAEPHEELGWTREEYQHWTETKEIPAAVESQQGVEVGSFLPPDVQEMITIIGDTKFARPLCDGSGGFGPAPDSGLIGWHACPGCENCNPLPTTLGGAPHYDPMSAEHDGGCDIRENVEDILKVRDSGPTTPFRQVPSDRIPRKKKRPVDRARLTAFVEEMPRWHVRLDEGRWTVRCDVHGLADDPNDFGGDVREALERADQLNRDYQMRYIDSLDEEDI